MKTLGPWIRLTISTGAVLQVEKASKGFRAMIDWRDSERMVAITDDTIENALLGLDEALQEDAADEMIEAGVV